jgi:hypothetical protein
MDGAKEDLFVRTVGNSYVLEGLWLDRVPGVRPPSRVGGFEYRTAAKSFALADLLVALELLAPTWRDE